MFINEGMATVWNSMDCLSVSKKSRSVRRKITLEWRMFYRFRLT